MKYAFALVLASLLAVSTVSADMLTGDWGRRMMYGGGSIWGILSGLFFLGLLLIVWLWVIKLYREVFPKHKK
jgi:hypothetical protein